MENKGKLSRTMMQTLELQRLVERHISGQSSEEIKPIASVIIELLILRHQVVSQSVKKSVK